MTVIGGYIHKIGLLSLPSGESVPETLGFNPDRLAISNGQSWVNYEAHLQYYMATLNGNASGGNAGARIGTLNTKFCIVAGTGVLKWHEVRVKVNSHGQDADYYVVENGVELDNTVTVTALTTGSYSDSTECAVTRGNNLHAQRDTSPIATGYVSQSHILYGFVFD